MFGLPAPENRPPHLPIIHNATFLPEKSVKTNMCRQSMVEPKQHPLNTGIAGRVYDTCDFVKPILDSMDKTFDKAHGTGISQMVSKYERLLERQRMEEAGIDVSNFNLIQTVDTYAINQYDSNTRSPRPNEDEKGSLCKNCGTKNRVDILLGFDGRYVCKCGAECGVIMGTDFKETNDTERSLARGSVSNKDTESRLGVFTHPLGTKKMAMASAVANAANKTDDCMTKVQQKKLAYLIREVDNLIVQVGKVNDNVAKKIRMDAEFVFKASVKHHSKCKKRECQKMLFDRPVMYIAMESFVSTVDQLSSNGMHGVSTQSIMSLQQHVQRSDFFNARRNTSMHQTCLAMISAICNSDNDVVCPDVNVKGGSSCLAGKSVISSTFSLARQDSNIQTTHFMQLRDSIRQFSTQCSCSSDVRDGAINAIQNLEFMKQISQLDTQNVSMAYLVLKSVAEEFGKSTQLTPIEHFHTATIDPFDLESILSRVRSALPKCILDTSVSDEALY